MKIKYVEELNYNEFIKLCNANNVIQEEAYNEATESARLLIIDDWLYGTKGIDYRLFDYNGGDYIKATNTELFLRDLQKMQSCFGLFREDIEKLIDSTIELDNKSWEVYCNAPEEEYEKLQEEIDEAIETLEDELLDIIHREYNYACDHYDEFFAEFMDDYQSELNTCFVVNADTFELIEIEEEAIC